VSDDSPTDPQATQQLYAALNAGLELFRRGRYFDAHEAWEWVWRRQTGRRRTAAQGLIQLAASLHKRQRGQLDAFERLLGKAIEKLSGSTAASPSVFGMDLRRVRESLPKANADARDLVFEPLLPKSTGPDGFVYLHGFASGPSSAKGARIVPPLRERGYSVAMPDLNAGGFRHLTVSRALEQASRHLRDRTIVIGSSMGGYIAALLAKRDPRVRALVLMAPAFDLADRLEARHGADAIAAWRRAGYIDVEHYAYGRILPLDAGFLDDAARHPARPPLQVPTYILQGERDDVVPADMVRAVAGCSGEHVRLDVVEDDHGLVASANKARDAALDFATALGFRPDPVAALDDPDGVLARLE